MFIIQENAFTDECTANPTWQMINRICNDNGYTFNEYARVDVDESGKQTLEDIIIEPKDKNILPTVEIDTSTKPFKFTITTPGKSLKGDLTDYGEYLQKLSNVRTMLEELTEINFYDLYQNLQMD